MDPFVALVPIVAFAFMVETAVGFGGMVITLALGTLVLPIDAILPRVVPLNLALSCLVGVRHGKHAAHRHLALRILPFVLLGMPFGLLAFERLNRTLLTLLFGVFVLVLAIAELMNGQKRADPPRPLGTIARSLGLAAAGFMQGAFSTGGPMLVYVTARELPQKARFRATLSLAWVVLGSVLLTTYVVTERINAETFGDSLKLALPMLLGLVLGEQVHARIEERLFGRFVYGMLAVASLFVIARSLW